MALDEIGEGKRCSPSKVRSGVRVPGSFLRLDKCILVIVSDVEKRRLREGVGNLLLSLQLFCKSKIIPEYKVYFRKSGPECTFLFG